MKQIGKYSRKGLAGFMSIWLSGIALLLFCQLPARASGSDYCPLTRAAKSHCDRATQQSKTESFSQSTPEAFDCCAFIPAVFDKTRKIDRHPQPAGIAEKPEPLRLKIRPVRHDWPKGTYAFYLPVPDRIFIKLHALRI
jgi:hypothetical protein